MQARTETLTDVPPKLVDQIVAGFTSDGAAKIEKHVQPDGRWTVIAVFDAGERPGWKARAKS